MVTNEVYTLGRHRQFIFLGLDGVLLTQFAETVGKQEPVDYQVLSFEGAQ